MRCSFCLREYTGLTYWLKIPDCLPGYVDWEGQCCLSCATKWNRQHVIPQAMRVQFIHAMRSGICLEVDVDIQDDGAPIVRSVRMDGNPISFDEFAPTLKHSLLAEAIEHFLKGAKR